ncbi:lipopolysaccharide biosynthesis protein [Oleispirillum naphthae]|uniref:lipopolysaccharide biosynthesis protein n=1 Tax=Oleispirillum naphthae TaxID=2838853 RepID=UPI0030825B69
MNPGRIAWITRSIGPLAMSQAFAMACGLATTTVWARFLPVETYGEFRTVLSVISFVSTFCLLGTAQAATMAAAQNRDGSLIPLLRGKMLASGVGSLALAGAAVYYGNTGGGSSGIAAALVVAAVVFPFYNVADIWQAWVNGKARFVEQALGRGAIAMLNLAAVAGGALLGLGHLWPILAAYMAAQAAVNAVILTRAAMRRKNRDIDPAILRYGNHATAALVFNSLLSLDMVILNHYASAAEVAAFAIAMQFPEQLKTVFSVIIQAAAPTIYRSVSVVESWRTLRHSFWLLYAGMVVLGVAGVFLLPTVVRWLFSERYAHAAEYGKWLWLCMALTGPIGLLGHMLLATKQKFFLYAPNIGFPLLQAGLYLYLARDGIAGMTTARIIATTALGLLHVANLCARYRFETRRERA